MIAHESQLGRQLIGGLDNSGACFFFWRDRDDHNVCRRDARRQNQTIIIGVRHDQRADHARGHAPARRPAEFLFAVARLKLNPAGAREILAKEMRRAGLHRFAVLHHRLDAQRLHRAGKTFAR